MSGTSHLASISKARFGLSSRDFPLDAFLLEFLIDNSSIHLLICQPRVNRVSQRSSQAPMPLSRTRWDPHFGVETNVDRVLRIGQAHGTAPIEHGGGKRSTLFDSLSSYQTEYASAISDAVRTSLGPRGMDKMVMLLEYRSPFRTLNVYFPSDPNIERRSYCHE